MSESDTSKITSRLGNAPVVPGQVEDRDEPTEPAGRARGQWDPSARERDARYGEALERSRAGDKRGALESFDRFCADFPGHVHARLQLFQLALELRDQP